MGAEVHWDWDITGKPCPALPEALELLQMRQARFLVCSKGDQESGYEFIRVAHHKLKGYRIEASIGIGPNKNALYSYPGVPDLDEVNKLLLGFSDGEDFSFVRQTWRYLAETERPLQPAEATAVTRHRGVLISHWLIRAAVFVLLIAFFLRWLYSLFFA